MDCRKAGLGSHWVSSPFEVSHREASSRTSRTLSRSSCCARIILTSDLLSTKTVGPKLILLSSWNLDITSMLQGSRCILVDAFGRALDKCYRISIVTVRDWLSLPQPTVLVTRS